MRYIDFCKDFENHILELGVHPRATNQESLINIWFALSVYLTSIFEFLA